MRPLFSNHPRKTAAVTSYAAQNSGHQVGTPGLEMTAAWLKWKMPGAAGPGRAAPRDHVKPATAPATKTARATHSRTSTCVEAPIAAYCKYTATTEIYTTG